ncbi:MAG TPA: cytochrome c [Woeseiaceae bacterium]|nr:cytochrome c [Woeseiaceae bacterium]
MITASRFLAVAAVAVVVTASARPAAAAGNPEQGKRLVYTCLGCHGIEGYRNAYPSYRVPKLGGQKRAYLEAALKEYRAGKRPHPTMQAQGTGLSDQDIEDIAAFLEGGDTARDKVTAATLGGLEVAKTCLSCHGADAADVVPTPPTLSGQHQSYLQHALTQYRSGARAGTVMSAFAGSLSDEDIAQIAAFYSRQDGLRTPDRNR